MPRRPSPTTLWIPTKSREKQAKRRSLRHKKIHSQVVGTGSSLAPERAPFYRLIRQTASALSPFLERQKAGESVPHLKLVRIGASYTPGHGGFSMLIARGLFDGLLERFKADPWVIWLMGIQYDGSHHIKTQGRYVDTFFFGSYHQVVIWTFDPVTTSTRILLVDRAVPSEITSMYALSLYSIRASTGERNRHDAKLG